MRNLLAGSVVFFLVLSSICVVTTLDEYDESTELGARVAFAGAAGQPYIIAAVVSLVGYAVVTTMHDLRRAD